MKKRKKSTYNRLPHEGGPEKKRGNKVVGAHTLDVPDAERFSKSLTVVLCLALVLSTLAVYSQMYNHGFIAYDDNQYVYENAKVKNGLTLPNIAWAFSTFYYANWHPLTWLSHMTDCQLFGLNPGLHHGMNLFFHMANVLLLFAIFMRVTRRPWRSFFVAGIFALHPLHVESVAWISERKDVLSTLFGLLSLYFYIRHAEKPAALSYALLLLNFAMSLMAKPMLVTLPFVFLLLDIWPLKRMQIPFVKKNRALIAEKIPLLVMAAVSSALTYMAQHAYGAVIPLVSLPLSQRIGNAAIAYCLYLVKAFRPSRLAVLYPIQTPVASSVIFAAIFLLAVTIIAVFSFKKRPYILTGWLWYIGMLVPVIGIVQVGVQSMADRYTYLPLVGISAALVWLLADIGEERRIRKSIYITIGCALFLCLGLCAFRQTAYWKSSLSLFEHTLAVTDGNFTIHNNLGTVLEREGMFDDAMTHYREALSINDNFAEAHANLGFDLLREGKFEEAGSHLFAAVRINPKAPKAQGDLGTFLAAQGRFDESITHFEKCLSMVPDYPEIQCNLCYALLQLKRPEEALAHCTKALQLKPGFIDARYNLGMAFAAMGRNAEARAEFSNAVAADPNYLPAKDALERLNKDH
ncbi:MAG: tetratricopeptide repeat protein [Chitinivibrionales bacterium]